MDPFAAMLRFLEAMFWVAAGMFAIVYRIVRFLFFFWRAHHKTPLEFPLSARFEHTHIVAGSGHGKTQLLQQLILNDLDGVKSGQASIIVIDSQGDMLKNILSLAEVGKMQDRLVLIDPVIDIQNPPALNLFDLGLKRLDRYDEIEQEKLINGAIAL
jgi:hypothetical protein